MGLFTKNPRKTLQRKYENMMRKSLEAQRGGNIQKFALLYAEGQTILRSIEELPPCKPAE